MLSAQKFPSNHVVHDFFSLDISYYPTHTVITMVLNQSLQTTDMLPQTHELLEKYLPTIFISHCFNDQNLSFSDEVKNTEIAHLFEHMLLVYMYHAKTERGYTNITYDGVTKWKELINNKQYQITISSGTSDTMIFHTALEKSIKLLDTILLSKLAKPKYESLPSTKQIVNL